MTDDLGRPVAGAVVRCVAVRSPGSVVYVEQPGVEVETDGGGQYEVSVEPGRYVVRARAANLGSERAEVEVPRADPLDLQLIVPNARIVISLVPALLDIDLASLDVQFFTNRGKIQPSSAPGVYTVEELLTGDVVSLGALLRDEDRSLALLPASPEDTSRNYLVKDRRMHAGPVRITGPEVGVEFRVTRLPRLSGLILGSDGGPSPRAGYRVLCRTVSRWQPVAEMSFGSEGTRYTMWALPEPPLDVFVPPVAVEGEGFVGLTQPVHIAPLAHGERREVDLRLEHLRSHEVTGRVVHTTGTPPTRASLTVVQTIPGSPAPGSGVMKPFTWTRTVTSESDGRFRVAGLLPAESRLRVNGFDPRSGAVAPLPVPILIWPASEVDVGEICLVPPGAIAGTVRACPPEARGGRRVLVLRAVPASPDGAPMLPLRWTASVEVRSDATFRFDGLPPGRFKLLTPGPIGEVWSAALAEAEVVSGETVQVEISPPPP